MSTPGAPSRLSLEETRKVAALARLALDDAALEAHQRHLTAVLGYMDQLRKLDLAGVEPMAHPFEHSNRMDEDVARPPLDTSIMMALAPEAAPPFLKVPKVLGDGSSS